MDYPLQVETRHAAQLDVRDDQAGMVVFLVVEEGFGRKISPHDMAGHAQQSAQRLAHACVVINDRNEGRDL